MKAPLLALALCTAAAAVAAPLPPYTYYNASLLAQTQAAIAARAPSVWPAYTALLSAADAALRRGPYSVTQQYNASLIPFPCDPRAYTSVGFYYWPCTMTPPGQAPRNATCNASSGLPWVYWDGQVSPFAGDFDLYVWGDLASAVQTLRQARRRGAGALAAQQATGPQVKLRLTVPAAAAAAAAAAVRPGLESVM
jgi:hypothetical protein